MSPKARQNIEENSGTAGHKTIPVIPALTIGGSDNCGGAGIQADIKTFMAFGCYGLSAIAAITAQSADQFLRFEAVSPELVYDQIKLSVQTIKPLALKTGMLATPKNVKAVARAIRDFELSNLVIDPVLKASAGGLLAGNNSSGPETSQNDFLQILRSELLPLASVVTPNAPEAEALTGMKIRSYADVETACRLIHEMGASSVVLKGGHLDFDPEHSVDTLYSEGRFRRFSESRLNIQSVSGSSGGTFHGTGCAFSAALCANLATAKTTYAVQNMITEFDFIEKAVKSAKDYVLRAMKNSRQPGLLEHDVRTWS